MVKLCPAWIASESPKNYLFVSPRPVLQLCIILCVGYFLFLNSNWECAGSGRTSYLRWNQRLDDDGFTTHTHYISSICNCGKKLAFGANTTLDNPTSSFDWCSPDSSVRGAHQKVISYSLFGKADNASVFKRYFSLLANLSMTAEKSYPGWVLRIYHDIEYSPTGPKRDAYYSMCDVYCGHQNVDLCSVPLMAERLGNSTTPIDPAQIRGLNPKMTRFLPLLDPNVDLYISRDVDSLIWQREVDAVDAWLRSNYTFHIMRDNLYHGSIMLAGMWGVKVNQRRDLIEGLGRALVLSGQNPNKGQDQIAMADILWPVAKYDVMAHDSYHCKNEYILRVSAMSVFPFPTQRQNRLYVGGAGSELYAEKCPVECRPKDHLDWEYC